MDLSHTAAGQSAPGTVGHQPQDSAAHVVQDAMAMASAAAQKTAGTGGQQAATTVAGSPAGQAAAKPASPPAAAPAAKDQPQPADPAGAASAPAASTGLLNPGRILRPGQSEASVNGQYVLVMQTDGNLVLYRGTLADASAKNALWSTQTSAPGALAAMQTDGNLVVYSKSGTVLWSSGTYGNAGAFANVQTDGNFVIYDKADNVLWDRSMFLGLLPSGYELAAGEALVSVNRHYLLLMQTDGNLVLYRGTLSGSKTALWSTATSSPGAFAVMQRDGNLVVYSKSKAVLWASNTAGHPGAYLNMQTDGNLVIYSAAKTSLWATGTTGK